MTGKLHPRSDPPRQLCLPGLVIAARTLHVLSTVFTLQNNPIACHLFCACLANFTAPAALACSCDDHQWQICFAQPKPIGMPAVLTSLSK